MAAILFTTSLWLVRILTAFNEENVWPWMEHWLLWGHVLEQSTCIILTEIGKIRYLSVTIVLKHPDSFTFLLCSISLLVKYILVLHYKAWVNTLRVASSFVNVDSKFAKLEISFISVQYQVLHLERWVANLRNLMKCLMQDGKLISQGMVK